MPCWVVGRPEKSGFCEGCDKFSSKVFFFFNFMKPRLYIRYPFFCLPLCLGLVLMNVLDEESWLFSGT